jgi:hypothetical protein
MAERRATHLLALLGAKLVAVGYVVLRDVVEHVGDGAAGRDGVDGDLLVAAVLGHDADEGLDGALGAGVEGVLGHGEVLGRVGGHEDDAAAAAEVAVRLARHEELRPRVDAEHPVEFVLLFPPPTRRSVSLSVKIIPGASWPGPAPSSSSPEHTYLGHIAQVAKAHHPGVAADDVEAAKVLDRVIHQLGRLRHLSDVGLEGDRVRAQALDLRHHFLRRFPRVGVVDDDFGAAAAELDGHGGADAAARAGDEGDFSVQAVGDVGAGHFVGGG